MAAIRSIDFLPEVFRTDANKKFLGATLDQLIQEPDFRKVSGFVGRTLAPSRRAGDNYVEEPTTARQNYQLEASTIVKNSTGDIEFLSTYTDLVDQIQFNGGLVNDHSRLFASEYYNFTSPIDYDKFVNFNRYYWLPNGPDAVQVFAGTVDLVADYTVTSNSTKGGYVIAGKGVGANPELVLARGGTYTFNINQAGNSFWIQTEPGTTGTQAQRPTLTTRQVFGVENNGVDSGTVTFNVPLETEQSFFTTMPYVATVDFATTLNYSQIHNKSLSALLADGGIDGFTGLLSNKTLVFVGRDADDTQWTAPGVMDWKPADSEPYDFGTIVDPTLRYKTWKIKLEDAGNGDSIVRLIADSSVEPFQKVFVTSGVTNANREYYLESDKFYREVPPITANLDILYYQDASRPGYVGVIKLVNPNNYTIDVEQDILGKLQYTSPNGVTFTNGLKIEFDTSVVPDSYQNQTYYVEQVGRGIRLVKESVLEANEIGNTNTADYFTINRASVDINAWSRSNRWVHQDVLIKTAKYNNTVLTIDQNTVARRPIIEYDADLQLFNNGRIGRAPIDILDQTITDAFNQIDGKLSFTLDGVVLEDGNRIIFANDTDPLVRNKIYTINFVTISNQPQIHLTEAVDGAMLPYYSVAVKQGSKAGLTFWFDGADWISAQQKTSVNQYPLFDIFDTSYRSLANSFYTTSSFAGTRLFGYKDGTGRVDPILGIKLSYRNFTNFGDIEFTNNYDVDTYTYLSTTTPVEENISKGFFAKIVDRTTLDYLTPWTTVKEPSSQYQIFTFEYTGKTSYFDVDVTPSADQTYIPHTKVYVNNKLLTSNYYKFVKVGTRQTIKIDPTQLTVGGTIDVLILSTTASNTAFYEIPLNLDFNATNGTFETLTLGQVRNHYTEMIENTADLVDGEEHQLRDLDLRKHGGNILQQSAPVHLSNLFLCNENLNFVSALNYSAREYTKFKNRFLETSIKLASLDYTDAVSSVDEILKSINNIKTSEFPWYYSDMVPYGDNRVEYNYTVFNPLLRNYEIGSILVDNELNSRAVLVYVNGVQLIKGTDYTFSQTQNAVTFADSYTLEVDDSISIVEFLSTDGNYIPETPTKLGLYPKFVPGIVVDSTYQTPVEFIQGHDGSLTPVFNDFRDELLLELEKRIYNNIKLNESKRIDIWNYIPGKFRDYSYTLAEFNRVLTKNFLSWAGTHKVDFTSNSFESNNPWTWNYKKFNDKLTNQPLQGSWRAIYKHFYDTDRPHTHPWEMLGFSEQPSWWENRYGLAPYTGGNLVLWEDLELGYIHGEDRVDARFARPELTKIIPVDEYGDLRSPDQVLTAIFNSYDTDLNFGVGEIGAVEAAWRRSSEYAFAINQAIALTRPAEYFGIAADVNMHFVNTETQQYQVGDNNKRLTTLDIKVNSNTTKTAGYINWVGDYLKNLGINPATKIPDILGNTSLQLSYKMAGFTDKKFLTVVAEQASPSSANTNFVIPQENYSVLLNKSTPIKKIVYSGVIVEKSDGGYVVSGYNTTYPYFTIIPSNPNNNSYAIEVGKYRGTIYKDYQSVKVTIPYGYEFTSRQQVVDFLVSYQRYLTSQGFIFNEYNQDLTKQQDWVLSAEEFLSWSQQGWKSGALISLSPVFATLRVTSDFGVVDQIQNAVNGSKIVDQSGVVIPNSLISVMRSNNNCLITVEGRRTISLAELHIVQYEHSLVFDNTTVFNDVIFKPEVGSRQYRLKLSGNKTANWTGNLDAPGFVFNSTSFDEWQPGKDYLKGSLVIYKTQLFTALDNIEAMQDFDTTNWSMVDSDQIKTGLLPNFAYNASKFIDIYDVDNQVQDESVGVFGASLIGFRDRSYLSDLGLDRSTQVKFYQGLIRNKGTRNSIDALVTARVGNIDSEIDLHEEWAMRVGEYGAVDSNLSVEITLSEDKFDNNPSTLQLLNNEEIAPDKIIGIETKDLYKKSNSYTPNIFLNRESHTAYPGDILTAGHVNIDDVDVTLFDIRNYAELNAVLNKTGKGLTIWVAKDTNGSWNVYRIGETNNSVTEMAFGLNSLVSVQFLHMHGLAENDIICIRGLDDLFDGFYQVQNIDDLYNVKVLGYKNMDVLKKLTSVTGNGVFYKLESVKFDYLTELVNYEPMHGWIDGDRVWINHYLQQDQWATAIKSSPWNFNSSITSQISNGTRNSEFGYSIVSNNPGDVVLVSEPGANLVRTFAKLSGEAFVQNGQLLPKTLSADGFGRSQAIADFTAIVGAPLSVDNTGEIYIFNLQPSLGYSATQVVRSPNDTAGDLYGSSVSINVDNYWLAVGAPGEDAVYVYKLNDLGIGSYNNSLVTDGSSTDYELYNYEIFISKDEYQFDVSIIPETGAPVYVNNVLQVEGVDYTRSGYTFEFNDTIPEGYTVRIATSYFTPASQNALTVESNDTIFVPGTDFTIAGHTLTFASAPSAQVLDIKQAPYYSQFTKINGPANSSFGYQVKWSDDASRLIISAKDETVDGNLRAGAVYVYNRSNENVIAPGTTSVLFKSNLSDVTRVFVNGIRLTGDLQYEIRANQIAFATAPTGGYVVRAETNEFTQTSRIVSQTPTAFAEFGYSIDLCRNNCSLYIGAPGHKTNTSQNGIVERHVNNSNILGYDTSTIANPAILAGDSIRINDFVVTMSGTTVAQAVATINSARLPGIKAYVDNNKLKIVSDSTNTMGKLFINPQSGSAYTDIGFNEFTFAQEFTKVSAIDERFGSRVRISANGSTLLIGSEKGSATQYTTFDNETTILDSESTNFVELVKLSGAVYLYELLTDPSTGISNAGQMIFSQQFSSSVLRADDAFGTGLEINGNNIFAGAPYNDSISDNGGLVRVYTNSTGKTTWNVDKLSNKKVDVNAINKILVYSKSNQLILDTLDYIDPVKGKVLGSAEQYLDYKTDYDPATYNRGVFETNADFHWSEYQIGKVWWDLSTVRFVDYEQDSLIYRTKNWSKEFPGSSIDVYEWIESDVLPSEYTGPGVPRNPDNTRYVELLKVNPSTRIVVSKYYFWVKNKSTSESSTRMLGVEQIADIIKNPEVQGIAYLAPIRNDAVALYNINRHLSGDDAVLQISYDKVINTNVIHNEWQLVQENNKDSEIPTRIIDKFIDSLSGADVNGNIIPDPGLSAADKIGILVRPRQTMFINRFVALKNLVQYVNNIFKDNLITTNYTLTNFNKVDPVPPQINADGTTAWDTSTDLYEDLSYIDTNAISVGYTVLVYSDTTNGNRWAIYEYTGSEWYLQRIQSYRTTDYWKKINWYASDYDPTSKITRTLANNQVLQTIQTFTANEIIKVLDNGAGEFEIYRVTEDLALELVGRENGTIELLSKLYNLSASQLSYDMDKFDSKLWDENPSIEVRHIINGLKNDIFVGALSDKWNNMFFFMINYILAEQKSVDWLFKTSFVSVLHRLRKLEQLPYYVRDNQDYYLDYINEVKPFRTQIREYVLDYQGQDDFKGDITDFDLPPAYDLATGTFHGPQVTANTNVSTLTGVNSQWAENFKYKIESVTVADDGEQYYVTPELTVTGGGGTGANLRAVVNFSTNSISHVEVVSSGTGYTSTPTITINGTGTGARLYPNLQNNTIRKIKSVLKFDRTQYDYSVYTWTANTAYTANTVVAYNGQAYQAVNNVSASNTFDFTQFAEVASSTFNNAVDRIVTTYVPNVNMPSAYVSTFTANTTSSITGNVIALDDITGVHIGMEVSGNGATASRVIDVFSNSSVLIDNNQTISNASVVTFAKRDLSSIIEGLGYSGVSVDGLTYSRANIDAVIDTSISSRYTDANLGLRPEDINVDGGAYVDRYNSHAPEELVPGIVYDALDMKVFTKINSNATILAYRAFTTMNQNTEFYRISTSASTLLAQDFNITDTVIHLVNAGVLPEANVEMNYPGIVFINGEKITYWTIDYENNTIGQLMRGVDGTAIGTTHAVNSLVVDGSMNQLVPGPTEEKTWMNLGSGAPADGTGFEGSETSAVTFLKGEPWVIDLILSTEVDPDPFTLSTEDITTEDGDILSEE